MGSWVLWTVAACVLAVGEMLSMGLFLAPFAVGAALAAVLSLAGLGAAAAVIAFVIGSGFTLGVLRRVARGHTRLPPGMRTGSAALVGRSATVLERIANAEAVGCVRIDGEVWTARAYDEDHVIEAGQQVHVMEIRGATALVIE